MAAISYPSPQPLRHPRPQRQAPPAPRLRLLQGGLAAPRRPQVAPGIYARRRILALVLVAIVSMVLVVAVQAVASGLLVQQAPAPTAATAAVDAPAGAEVHVVQPGETLWAVAAELTPAGGDVRATVDRLVERNGGQASLQVGQRLVVD